MPKFYAKMSERTEYECVSNKANDYKFTEYREYVKCIEAIVRAYLIEHRYATCTQIIIQHPHTYMVGEEIAESKIDKRHISTYTQKQMG